MENLRLASFEIESAESRLMAIVKLIVARKGQVGWDGKELALN